MSRNLWNTLPGAEASERVNPDKEIDDQLKDRQKKNLDQRRRAC